MRWQISMALGILLTAWVGVPSASPEGAATLLTNARIASGDPSEPDLVEAMVIRDGRVLALGRAAALRQAHPGAREIDAGGRTVLPGLIDAHAHLMNLGHALLNADLAGADSKAEIVARLQAFARELPSDAWLLGRGWDQNRWPERAFPTAADLDAVFPDRPVWLKRVDGHAGWANSAALRALPADAQSRLRDADWQPEGGRVLRDPDGPTGVLIDTAMDLVAEAVPAPDAALQARALQRALAEAVRFGLTGVHDMGVSAQDMALMRRFADRGALPLRITAYADGDAAALAGLCAFGPYRHPGGRLQMRGVKLYADGALGSRGAALLEDYADEPGHRGLMVMSAEQLRAAMLKARDCGLQVAAHGIGDRGNRVVLDLAAEVLGDAARGDHRWRVEHAQVVALDDIPRFAALGMAASVQPTHATSDMPWAGDRIGAERLRGAYAWRRFLDAGVALPLGSDFPVEAVDPMLGLYAAVTRQDLAGRPPGGWLADQRLSRHEALYGFTAAAARAGFAESEVGTLAPGMRADFVILEDDYFEVADARLPRIRVHSTWVDGEAVYRAGDAAP